MKTLSIHRPSIPPCGLALLIAACGVLLSTSGAQAAHRGAVLVKDIHPGRSGSITGPNKAGDVAPQLTNASGTLYFSADDGRHGHELWRSDGTSKGTRMVKDINSGPAGSLFQITPSSSGTPFYFFADDGVHGAELWGSDGTAAGTSLVKDLTPGPGAGLLGVSRLTNVNGTLYFSVCTCIQAPPTPGLWRSDGTEAGTARVKQIIGISSLTDVNGTLYFSGASDKFGLWRSDGTAAGTPSSRRASASTRSPAPISAGDGADALAQRLSAAGTESAMTIRRPRRQWPHGRQRTLYCLAARHQLLRDLVTSMRTSFEHQRPKARRARRRSHLCAISHAGLEAARSRLPARNTLGNAPTRLKLQRRTRDARRERHRETLIGVPTMPCRMSA